MTRRLPTDPWPNNPRNKGDLWLFAVLVVMLVGILIIELASR
jgi:hypothetical protein